MRLVLLNFSFTAEYHNKINEVIEKVQRRKKLQDAYAWIKSRGIHTIIEEETLLQDYEGYLNNQEYIYEFLADRAEFIYRIKLYATISYFQNRARLNSVWTRWVQQTGRAILGVTCTDIMQNTIPTPPLQTYCFR